MALKINYPKFSVKAKVINICQNRKRFSVSGNTHTKMSNDRRKLVEVRQG